MEEVQHAHDEREGGSPDECQPTHPSPVVPSGERHQRDQHRLAPDEGDEESDDEGRVPPSVDEAVVLEDEEGDEGPEGEEDEKVEAGGEDEAQEVVVCWGGGGEHAPDVPVQEGIKVSDSVLLNNEIILFLKLVLKRKLKFTSNKYLTL